MRNKVHTTAYVNNSDIPRTLSTVQSKVSSDNLVMFGGCDLTTINENDELVIGSKYILIGREVAFGRNMVKCTFALAPSVLNLATNLSSAIVGDVAKIDPITGLVSANGTIAVGYFVSSVIKDFKDTYDNSLFKAIAVDFTGATGSSSSTSLINFLGWTTTIPVVQPTDNKGDFYYKGTEPLAEGFYVFDGNIWVEVLYNVPLPEYLLGTPANFNYGAATNYPFTDLAGQEIKVKPEDMDRKFTQSLSNISGTTTGQYTFIIDVAGSTLPDNTDVYLDFEWWFDYDSVTTSSEVQIWLGGQRLDMLQTNTGNAAIGGHIKGWYKIKKSLNKAMALR